MVTNEEKKQVNEKATEFAKRSIALKENNFEKAAKKDVSLYEKGWITLTQLITNCIMYNKLCWHYYAVYEQTHSKDAETLFTGAQKAFYDVQHYLYGLDDEKAQMAFNYID